MTTVFDVVRSSADVLRKAGVDTPEHDAKLLLAEALHVDLRDVDKAMLMGDDTERLAGKNDAESALERFRAMLDRRARREPLQHITGHAPFRYLDLKVGPGVFVPRPETELVVQEGIDWTTSHGMYSARVVDLCAGSGAIGLSFAMEVPGSEVWAVEKSATAAEWTRRNLDETVRRHPNIAGNYHLDIADATQMPTLSQLDGTIDIVLTNPPYVPLADIPEQPEARDYDPDLALYGGSADGTLIPERIIARAAKLLRADGLMVMEHDITQGERLAAFARTCGFVDVTVHNDYTGRPRYLTAEKQPAQ
ncbi:peptide chain release factor N(5)-glutamine methyltransferase [Bifidobacterium ruminantium]|mgnify:CR=1 FL=1|uniref:peptide chain release factor N(5)-glutamine methyltransferase n=1 Tax=Bifidobacterium ruminantium TaxID=78346 RepID=UPI001C2408FC|nr:peptide chain release factor N(5)-glutamine methyltransferase [Bifidobacterium ruminantium]MBU9111754.1 peptide chain release factor N(5)-glutamine methyltransferase [Bifidobacterium ruminantium]MEE0971364.1 peptide chain release factor N(5)-glutamine methyltransferase [Bifidobacterium ruminantium]